LELGKEMPALRTYSLFISHAWRYSPTYDSLVRMLRKARYFRYRNFSVPSYRKLLTKTKYELLGELRDQIRPTQVVLVLAGMYVAYSYWIQAEIDIAEGFGKPILGIYPWGSRKAPRAVQEAADMLVGWNTSSITTAVKELAR
jgi:hypothetical protein